MRLFDLTNNKCFLMVKKITMIREWWRQSSIFFNLQTHYPTVPLASPGPSNPLSKTELIFYLKKKIPVFILKGQELTRALPWGSASREN